jgi:hypothetical protein
MDFATALLPATAGADIVTAAFGFLTDNGVLIVSILGPFVGYKLTAFHILGVITGS